MLTIKDIENFKETFNDETPLGEPQHWIYLKSGRSLEVNNGDYYKTCGVITTLTATTAQDTLNCINAIMRTFKEMED